METIMQRQARQAQEWDEWHDSLHIAGNCHICEVEPVQCYALTLKGPRCSMGAERGKLCYLHYSIMEKDIFRVRLVPA